MAFPLLFFFRQQAQTGERICLDAPFVVPDPRLIFRVDPHAMLWELARLTTALNNATMTSIRFLRIASVHLECRAQEILLLEIPTSPQKAGQGGGLLPTFLLVVCAVFA
jgi:hypothetical protein